MNWMNLMEQNIIYILIALIGLIFILFILVIILSARQSRLNKKYKKFMKGSSGENLEYIIQDKFAEIDKLKTDTDIIRNEIENINENLLASIQKIGIVRYDAFKEMGGKLSFALAMLDKNNNGIILNSIHSSREGCYVYLKEIINGESYIELSKEEKIALEQAIKYNTFME
jgi:hypothetical protein